MVRQRGRRNRGGAPRGSSQAPVPITRMPVSASPNFTMALDFNTGIPSASFDHIIRVPIFLRGYPIRVTSVALTAISTASGWFEVDIIGGTSVDPAQENGSSPQTSRLSRRIMVQGSPVDFQMKNDRRVQHYQIPANLDQQLARVRGSFVQAMGLCRISVLGSFHL